MRRRQLSQKKLIRKKKLINLSKMRLTFKKNTPRSNGTVSNQRSKSFAEWHLSRHYLGRHQVSRKGNDVTENFEL